MQALVLVGPGAVELRDEPEPRVADGDRLVHVRAAGICGSELHGARTPGFRRPPLIMGHEFAGLTEQGEPVVVNPILSCGLLAARASGTPRVHVADLSPARLEVARRLGASAAGARLHGEYDIVFDAAGLAATRAQSVHRQRPGGVAVWLGLADAEPGFDAAGLVRSEKRVIGSFAYSDEEFASAATLLAGWDLSWVSRYPLPAGAQIFTELMNGASHPVKAVLQP